MNMTIKYIIGTMIKPNSTFEKLLADDKKFTRLWQMIVLMIVCFVIPNVGMVIIKAPSPVPPLLSIIPHDKFYHWIVFVGIPAQLPLFIMTSAIVHIMSKMFKGKNSFENTLAVNTFAIAVPFFFYCLFEVFFLIYILVTGNMNYGMGAVIAMAICLAITIIWNGIIVTLGIRKVHNLNIKGAITISVVAVTNFALFAALFFA